MVLSPLQKETFLGEMVLELVKKMCANYLQMPIVIITMDFKVKVMVRASLQTVYFVFHHIAILNMFERNIN